MRAKIFKLSEPGRKAIRFLSDRVDARLLSENEGKTTAVITITRTGKFFDPRYGDFVIDRAMLLSMVKNFESNVYGQDIVLDVSHMPHNGAAGFFRRLVLDGNKLRGEVEFTEYGVDAVSKKGFVYVSAEFDENFVDNEKREAHGPTLLGAGLTPRPVIKHLDRVQLSEEALDGAPMTLVSDRIARLLNEETEMNKFKKLLLAALAGMGLSESVVKQLATAFETAAKPLGEDETALKALSASFEETGKKLAEAIGDKAITLSIEAPAAPAAMPAPKKDPGEGAKTLSEDDVKRILAENVAAQQKTQADAAKKLNENKTTFNEALDEAEGLKTLSEGVVTNLRSAVDLVTGEMTEDQVKALAQHQIKLGTEMGVTRQLAGMGYQVAGNAHISVDDSNSVKSLQESVDTRLGYGGLSRARRYSATGGELQPENKALAEKVLADFDATHAHQLRAEHKMLAGGDGVVSDVKVPAVFERTVIREALYNLVGLQFVDAGTMPFASSGMIPYSYRDTAAAGRDNTRIYEGGSIPRAGVKQVSDTVYAIPQKLAFEISDELQYLTQSGILDFNAAMENVKNASRIVGEDTEQLIFNEVLRSSDEYGAIAVTAEVIDAAIDGTNEIFILANFPVVRPRAVYDLQGNAVGNVVNPVTVEYDSGSGYDEIDAFDGTGEQASGSYYVLDFNMGEIYLVDETGALITPAGTHTIRISYSRATNTYAFNTDPGSVDLDLYWNTALYRYGLRKSEIEDNRFHTANFGLMSGTAMNQLEQAKQFAANFSRNGTDLQTNGNLGRVKDIANFKTSAPGLNMGDQRVVIGERGQTRMRMMKPWSMGELENQKDSNGRFTGKKEAYGDQFIVMHTPAPLKRAYTSMTLYSATARVNRAAA